MPRQTSKGRSAHAKIAIPKTRRPEETARQKSCMQRPRNPASNTGPSTRQPPRRKEKMKNPRIRRSPRRNARFEAKMAIFQKEAKHQQRAKITANISKLERASLLWKMVLDKKGKEYERQNEPKEGTDAQPNAISRKALEEIQAKHRKIVMDRKRSRMAIFGCFVRLRKFCQTASLHLHNNHRGARAEARWRQCKKAVRECSDAQTKGVR